MKTLAIAKKISKYYNNKQVLDNVDFDILNNEIVSIFGPSGSGKTTFLNILGLIDNDYKGQLFINDVDVQKTKSKYLIRRTEIGFIFQFHHLLPEFNIYENLLLSLYHTDISEPDKNDLISDYLNKLNINKLKYNYPNQLSGGERQKVSVIRSIIHSPKLVIADEPTGNLDIKNSEIVLDLIHDLKLNSSISFVIATHDKNAAKISDRIFLLENKKLKLNR